jgi:excisionase family DNA binding protein
MPEPILTPQEVASVLKISVKTVRELLVSGAVSS